MSWAYSSKPGSLPISAMKVLMKSVTNPSMAGGRPGFAGALYGAAICAGGVPRFAAGPVRPNPWVVTGRDPGFARRVDQPEQLGVDVLVLLAGVRARRVHARSHPVRHGRPAGSVGGPVRDGVAELAAGHALERGHLARLVKAAEQVVERAVLKHDRDDVIERVIPTGSFHRRAFRCWDSLAG